MKPTERDGLEEMPAAAPHDPQVQRPIPDQEAVALGMTDLFAGESQLHRYIRQQWEAATGANKVALDAWRRVWPGETRYGLRADDQETAAKIEKHLAMADYLLDTLTSDMVGDVLDDVLQGVSDADDVRQELLRERPPLQSAPEPGALP
jgi:hypothetical protein